MPRGENHKPGEECPDQLKEHRFKPGQTGNPKGRPRTKLITRAYQHLLAERFPKGKSLNDGFKQVLSELVQEGASLAEMVAMMQIGQALKGKTYAASEIADRVEGKPKQTQQIVGPDDGPLQHLNIDLRQLDSEELRELARTLAKAQAEPEEEPDGAGDDSSS